MNTDIWSAFIDLVTYYEGHAGTYANAKTAITPFLWGDSAAKTAILAQLTTDQTANEAVSGTAQQSRALPYNRDNSVAAAAFYLAGITYTP